MTPGLLAGFSTIGHCQPCSGPTPAMLATEFERPAAGAVDDGCNRPSMAFSSHSFALAWVGCPTVQRHGGCYLVCLLGRLAVFLVAVDVLDDGLADVVAAVAGVLADDGVEPGYEVGCDTGFDGCGFQRVMTSTFQFWRSAIACRLYRSASRWLIGPPLRTVLATPRQSGVGSPAVNLTFSSLPVVLCTRPTA